MKARSIIDTQGELEQRISDFVSAIGCEDSAFIRFHIRKLIVDAQTATGARLQSNTAAALERPWTDVMPLPAGGNGATAR